MTTQEIKNLVTTRIAGQGTMVDAGSALPSIFNGILGLIDDSEGKVDGLDDKIGDLTDLETDHKSTIVDAINELFDAIETTELVVSMAQSTEDRKAIYDLCIAHPQLTKNVVFFNGDDNMYYRVNGYKIADELLHLYTIMPDTDGFRSVLVKIASNGSIAV